ncbi:uncharacterized, partial [Lates japonicus]
MSEHKSVHSSFIQREEPAFTENAFKYGGNNANLRQSLLEDIHYVGPIGGAGNVRMSIAATIPVSALERYGGRGFQAQSDHPTRNPDNAMKATPLMFHTEVFPGVGEFV